jgi:lipocalin
MLKYLILYVIIQTVVGTCPPVNFNFSNTIDLNRYTEHSWYVQYQQENNYQPADSLKCVLATYQIKNISVPNFNGLTFAIYNYNYQLLNDTNMTNFLCGRLPDETVQTKLLIGPSFLPNILAGDYFIIDYDPDYQWAIISGGYPTEAYPDGCTTKKKSFLGNDVGFWFFTKEQFPSPKTIEIMKEKAIKKGYTLSQLIKVNQTDCNYSKIFIK